MWMVVGGVVGGVVVIVLWCVGYGDVMLFVVFVVFVAVVGFVVCDWLLSY